MPEYITHELPSGFYNSRYVNNQFDRVYSASEMSKLFDGLILDGVYLSSKEGDETNKQFVTTALDTPAMAIKVAPGRAWFNGTYTVLPEETIFTIDPADETERTDILVIEVNMNIRKNSVHIVKGGELDEYVGVYQYPIAYITVRKNAETVETYDIRYVVGIETPYFAWLGEDLNISDLYSKWKSSLAKTVAPFNSWFYIMRTILGHGDQDYYSMKVELDDIKEHPYVMGIFPKVNEQLVSATGDGETTDYDLSSYDLNDLADILVDGKIVFNYKFDDNVVSFTEPPADGAEIEMYYVPNNNLKTYTLYFEEV